MTEITIITDLDRLCRTCLSQKNTEELRDIIQADPSISKQLCDLTSIEISVNDDLPKKICEDCCVALTIATNFREQCLRCDEHLRNALFSNQAIIYDSIAVIGETSNEDDCKNVKQNESEVETIQLTIEKDDSDNEIDIEGTADSDTKDNIDNPSESTKDQRFEDDGKISEFHCMECEKVFKHESVLNVHCMVKHGVKPTCSECSKEFPTMKEFRSHMKVHGTFKPYSCSICGKSFTQQHSKKKHMRTHTGDRKHLCTVCGKRFYEHNHLVLHTRIHTGEKPVSCKTCGKKFTSKNGLTTHNKMHTGEKNHECELCGRKFAHAFVLTIHKRTHTGEKPYKCNICNASFATSSYIRVHNRTHTLERPYQCDACPKAQKLLALP
nr:unnamed protein product [Callosobruchus chinensis]